MMVKHAGLTLANLKLASLFRVTTTQVPNIQECVAYFQSQCSPFGYQLRILKRTEQDCLIYLYHHIRLQSCLSSPVIQAHLSVNGYTDFEVDQVLAQLSCRLKTSSFPHEIGLFLGYPLADVLAFSQGQPCKFRGYWCVYCRVKQSQKKFNRFFCCLKQMEASLAKGMSLTELMTKLN